MRLRRTKGIGFLTMRRFCITDAWTQTSNAHRLLDKPWIGTTTFQEVVDYMIESEDSTTTANDDDDSTRQVAGRHRAQPNRSDDDPTRQGAGPHRARPNRTSTTYTTTTTSRTWVNPSHELKKLPAMSRDTAFAIVAAVQTTMECIFSIEKAAWGRSHRRRPSRTSC